MSFISSNKSTCGQNPLLSADRIGLLVPKTSTMESWSSTKSHPVILVFFPPSRDLREYRGHPSGALEAAMAGEWYFAFSHPSPRWRSKSPWTRPNRRTPTWVSRRGTKDPTHLSHGKSRLTPAFRSHIACVCLVIKSLGVSTIFVSFLLW